ncbi:MAG: TatD family hydrolase [Candidatus Micrarchaeota archaeon]
MNHLALIDAHCHLDSFKNLEEVIAESRREKMRAIITCGYSLESSLASLKIADAHKNFVFPVIGISPQVAMDTGSADAIMKLIRERKEEIVGVGEIGLDYHWGKTDEQKKRQRAHFLPQLSLALELALPVVIHSRNAEEDVLKILFESGAREVLLHCFSGSAEQTARATERGFSLTVPPMRSKNRRKVIKSADLKYLLVESDAPYIGKKPIDALRAVELIAEVKEARVEDVAAAACGNARKFFEI